MLAGAQALQLITDLINAEQLATFVLIADICLDAESSLDLPDQVADVLRL